MAFKIVFTVLAIVSIFACNKEKEHRETDEVAGAYMNTYTVDVIDRETGDIIGSRTVCDTIFIKRVAEEYEISNRKWLSNDYDENGWVDSMQGEIEPMETYHARHDLKTGMLSPVQENSKPQLFIEDTKLYWGEDKALEYSKVTDEAN